MHTVARNRSSVNYKTYSSKTALVDANGYKTGEYTLTYSALKQTQLVLSPAKGYADLKPFGVGVDYELVGVTCDMSCDLDEASIVWVNNATTDKHDYAVVAVRKSINHISYALKKVELS